MNDDFDPKALPLMKMRGGADYLQVIHRVVWLNETCASFSIMTDLVSHDPDRGLWVCKATIHILDEKGEIIRSASSYGQESDKDFPAGPLEKAETKAIGRALALLGFGTAHALADFDEGERVVDSPVTPKAEPASSTLSVGEVARLLRGATTTDALNRLWKEHARSFKDRELDTLTKVATARKAELNAQPEKEN